MKTPLCLLFALTLAAHADPWKLVWSDDFNRPGAPDPAKWTYEKGFVRNQELQFYTDNRRENARVEGGNLVIEARKERLADRPDFGGQDYSSGKLVTAGIADWTYGFVEVRAKLACGLGVWPAIWMLGADGSSGWPAMGEIDIMEHVGFDPGVVHGTIHTEAYNHVKKTQKGGETMVPDAQEQFHIYAIDWTADKIDFFVDDKVYYSVPRDPKDDHKGWPFDKRFHLIMNLAVGGNWGGKEGVDESGWPRRMEVDYVRVYQ